MLPFLPPSNQIPAQAAADGQSLQQGAMFNQAQFPTSPAASFGTPNIYLSGFSASNAAAAAAPLLPIPPSPFLNCPSVPPMMQSNQLGGFPQQQLQFGGTAQHLNQQLLALQLLGQSCGMPQNLQQFQGSVQALNIVNALQTNLGSFLPNSFSQNSNFLGGAPYGQNCLPNLMTHGNQIGVLSSPQSSFLGPNNWEFAGNCSMSSVGNKNASFSNASSSTEGNKNSLAHDGKHGSRVNQQNFHGPVSHSPMKHNSFMSNKQPRNLMPQVVEDGRNNMKNTSSPRNFYGNHNAKTNDANTRFQKPNFRNFNRSNSNMRAFVGVNVQKNRREGKSHFAKYSKPILPEPRRRIPVDYTENEIQQWIEARRKNYPTKANSEKKLAQSGVNTEDDGAKLRRQQLKEILAKQAELGVEIAEIPPGYLSESENQVTGVDNSSKVMNVSDRFSNMHNKRSRHGKDKWQAKRHNSRNDSSVAPVSTVKRREPSLLQKLLSSDIKRDKSKLLQVFKFMVLNSFFEHWPEKPLEFPSITVKDVQNDSRTADENTSTCMENSESDAGKSSLVKEIEGPTESCIVDNGGGASEDDGTNSRSSEVDGSINTDEHAE